MKIPQHGGEQNNTDTDKSASDNTSQHDQAKSLKVHYGGIQCRWSLIAQKMQDQQVSTKQPTKRCTRRQPQEPA